MTAGRIALGILIIFIVGFIATHTYTRTTTEAKVWTGTNWAPQTTTSCGVYSR